ncbi:hypothetical protein ES703_97588 [subsurface metagenome]
MIILDEKRLSQFFKSVSSGFERSLSEILLVIILLLAFMSFLILMYRIQKAKANREHIRRSQAEYEKLLLKFDLGPTEQNLIKRLAEFLKIPDKKYLLLLNQATFNSCVSKLREKEEIPAVALTGLRLKLGFTAQDPEKILSSSAELPERRFLPGSLNLNLNPCWSVRTKRLPSPEGVRPLPCTSRTVRVSLPFPAMFNPIKTEHSGLTILIKSSATREEPITGKELCCPFL